MNIKSFFYLILSLAALGILIKNPNYVIEGTQGRLDLCNLKEGQRGKLTVVVTSVVNNPKQQTTVQDPRTGCSTMVIEQNFPVQVNQGITFNALVQAGFLKLPTNLIYEDNLGTLKPYQEIRNYVQVEPRTTREKNLLVIDLYKENGRRFPLYISASLAKDIKYNTYNTFYYDSNRKIQQVIN